MQVHLKSLGCRLNEAELETWAQAFQQVGHSITDNPQQAQLIILNSCAVTGDAARKSRQLIKRLHRENPHAKLVVSGCYATLNHDEASALLGVDLIISNQNKNELVSKTLNELNMNTMPSFATQPAQHSLFTRGRQRAFIKVQDGCRYHCTFCIVTIARGEEKSRFISEIIDEINQLQAQGIHEIILTGVHLGGYGSDLNTNLVELIKMILKETNIERIRLGSLEPWEFSDDFFELFDNSRLMPHLHLPLQSGSNSVLKRMARRCKTQEFLAITEQLRNRYENFNITTDIIVGFPAESESEWQESIRFIEQIGFGHIHIFSYSKREGTAAAQFSHQIKTEIKKQRSGQLHQLAQQLKQQFFSTNLNKTFPVLWEAYHELLPNNKKRVFGYTPNYLKVACEIDNNQSLENKITPCRLISLAEDYILVE